MYTSRAIRSPSLTQLTASPSGCQLGLGLASAREYATLCRAGVSSLDARGPVPGRTEMMHGVTLYVHPT